MHDQYVLRLRGSVVPRYWDGRVWSIDRDRAKRLPEHQAITLRNQLHGAEMEIV